MNIWKNRGGFEFWRDYCKDNEYSVAVPTKDIAICFPPYKNLLYHQEIDVDGSRENMVGYIMKNNLGEHALAEIGLQDFAKNKVMMYDLCWYISTTGFGIDYTDTPEITFLSTCTIDELSYILGDKYKKDYIRREGEMIFAVLSGQRISRNPETKSYKTLEKINPEIAWFHAGIWVIHDEDYIQSPYSYIDMEYDGYYLKLLQKITPDNIDDKINSFGLISGVDFNTYDEKFDFFAIELYELVNMTISAKTEDFYRQRRILVSNLNHYDFETGKRLYDIGPVPTYEEIKSFDINIFEQALSLFTMREILSVYEQPSRIWRSKTTLLTLIQEEYENPMFRLKHNFCKNNDTMNLTTLKSHQYDIATKNDPIISYGYPSKYSCYQVSELEQTFRIYPNDGMFHFGVPDYVPGGSLGEKKQKYFPLEAIRELEILLLETEDPIYERLLGIIEEGLKASDFVMVTITRIRNTLLSLNNSQVYVVHIYLMWLFLFGMWLRQWKGPGFEWPYNGEDNNDNEYKCTFQERDEYFNIQMEVHNAILRLARLQNVDSLINDLPIFSYDFSTSNVSIVQKDISVFNCIEQIVDIMSQGKFCLAHGSDIILETSYYLLTQLLELQKAEDFDMAINRLSPMINETEKRVINKLINLGYSHPILFERIRNLRTTVIENKPFATTINKLKATKHVDPDFGNSLSFHDGFS